MASLKEHFEKDFYNTFKVSAFLRSENEKVKAVVHHDFTVYCRYVVCYFPESNHSLAYFKNTLEQLSNNAIFEMDGQVVLPEIKTFVGGIKFFN